MKIIFLNGPPRSGKDSAATALQVRFTGIAEMKFSDPVKTAVHAAFGLAHGAGGFEKRKDEPCAEFFGQIPRQCYINHSEKYMKPLYGQDIFGKLFVRRTDFIQYSHKKVIVISDSGFASEAQPVIEKFGAENCMLVRIHRQGCNYSKDSRSYLELPVAYTTNIHNDGELEDLAHRIIEEYERFVNGHV